MKKTLIITMFISIWFCVPFVMHAQNENSIDYRLLVRYSAAEISQLKTQNPQDYNWQLWLLDNSFEFIDVKPAKSQNLPELKHFDYNTKSIGDNVEIIDFNNFNIHDYYYERHQDKPSLYKIGNTGKIISFHSYKKLTQEYNKLRDEK